MNNVIISFLTLFLVFVTFTPGSVSSVRILINKMKMDGLVLKSANISCSAEDIGHQVKQIVSIELSGPGNVAIASVDYHSTVTLDKDMTFSKIEAEGNIHTESWKSHLTIVMTDIVRSQSGTYTCGIHYFDKEGFIRDNIATKILDAGEQDASQALLYMSSRISALEKINADRVQKEVIGELQKTVRELSQDIKDLREKDQPCGFSARYDGNDKFVPKEVLLFRHLDINIGDGYNATTGTFTAPRAGIYAFHLTVYTKSGQYVFVEIHANDQNVGSVFARNDYKDQSSVSVTVRLEEGQTVKPVVGGFDINVLNEYSHYSVFSGYMVQAM